jgi:glycosyltransferase involved in cell wall biosynthesis
VGDHYLVLSELVSHKQIDVAIEAFNRLELPLVITGGGPDKRRLRSLAGPTIRFAGRVNDDEAARLLASSRALVVTTGEEFGIAAVEAQAAGRPVIARAAGGLLENVIDGVTGFLWEGGPEDLEDAVRRFDAEAVDSEACIENARRFDSVVFRESFPRVVDAALNQGPTDRQDTWPRIPRRPTPSRRPAWRAGRFGSA